MADSTRFVYLHGITKQLQAKARRSLTALKINEGPAYAPALIKKPVSKGDTISHIENYDPFLLEPEKTERTPGEDAGGVTDE